MGTRPDRRWRAALGVAVAVQLLVVYSPTAGPAATAALPHLDKIVHAAVFAAVAFPARPAGVSLRLVVAALVVHAGLSELVQAELLAARSGDPWDAVADLAGTAAGALAGSHADRLGALARRSRG
ncbi:MAG: VanZ family protein [Actinomycetota bacterium]|nr:VanZ family protein [Actinomycetota bacterium]